VRDGDHWGYIDESGRVVIEPQFKHVTRLRGNEEKVRDSGALGYTDDD
jgi:hypothetical protein